MKELSENLEHSLKIMKTNYEEQIYNLSKEKAKIENTKNEFVNSNTSGYEYQIQMLTKSLSTKDQNYNELDKK